MFSIKEYLLKAHQLRVLYNPSYKMSGSCPAIKYGPKEVERSDFMNGIKVAAARTSGSPMTACTIMYQAGSRYETDNNLGASHFIRATSTCSGSGYSSFSKMRVLQKYGAYLTCTSNRQTICFTLRCPLESFTKVKYYLLDTACRCSYHNWEVLDRKSLVRDQISMLDPEQRAIDLVQKASWAGPLAYSSFCDEHRLDYITGDTLQAYAKKNFIPAHCTVASFGVPFDETMKLAEKISSPRKQPQTNKQNPHSSHRAGFEYYDLGPNSDTCIALAIPGCGTTDIKCLLKYSIIASACGGINMYRGQHELDRTSQLPLGMLSQDIFTNYKAFNLSYEDAGVFGIMVKTKSSTACKSAYSAAEFLSHIGQLDINHIEIGKKRLKLDICLHHEDCVKVSEGLALQLANNIEMDDLNAWLSMVDSISADEVSYTAKELASRRNQMAVAVVGDLEAAPTDQELFQF